MFEAIQQKDGWLLFLPLCPSTNARMTPQRRGNYCVEILTKDARNYIDEVSQTLTSWTWQSKYKPVDTYSYFDFWFILPRINCDSHNYLKILLDSLEAGGIVKNDKFILPRIQGVFFHPDKQVIIKLPGGSK